MVLLLWLSSCLQCFGANPPTADVLTEGNAAAWYTGAVSATATVTDRVDRLKSGSGSLYFDTNAGYDTWLGIPINRSADWNMDAAGVGGLAFWLYSETTTNYGFQNSSPWIRLHTSEESYFELHARREVMNDSLYQWAHVVVPLAGNDDWTITSVGTPDLTHINWLELHVDVWEFGFHYWFDGLEFTPLETPQLRTTSPVPNGLVSEPYSQTLTAVAGETPYTWSVSSGILPTGLSLSSDGILSGTPSAEGTSTFTLRVTGNDGLFSEGEFTLTIMGKFDITSAASLSDAILGSAYQQTLNVKGGTSPYTWEVSSGTLPPGFSLSSTGILSGTSNVRGAFTFTVLVTDSTSLTSMRAFTLAVTSGLTACSWQNFAGRPGGEGNVNGVLGTARFAYPAAVAVDPAGNTYAADQNNHTIRKIARDGTVTTFAGTTGQPGWQDGSGNAAGFYNPSGIVIDAAGNLYVADRDNNAIRKLTPAGVVTTLAGSLLDAAGGSDGTGSTARFSGPTRIAVAPSGDLYVADTGNHTIRKVTPAGEVTTLAGSAGAVGNSDGTGPAARFNGPADLSVDTSSNIFVADRGNHTIRKITPAGVVITFAGTGGTSGTADGTGASARFKGPAGVAADASGNIYVADTANCSIRKVTTSGVVSTLAGYPGGYGATDGTGNAALFFYPAGITMDASGNLVLADQYNHTIRRITPGGVVTTLSGVANAPGTTDGTGSAAGFNTPYSIAIDTADNAYIADHWNHTIRKVTPTGVVTTLAGSPGTSGSANGTGSAARFNQPAGIAVDSTGNLYVSDFANHTIRKVTSTGVVTTLAGTAGSSGSTDANGSAARFNLPFGITADTTGNLYVADRGNHAIRKITSTGAVTTLAGSAGTSGSMDGTGAAAKFKTPMGVAVDISGNVFVADSWNHTIRKITPVGVVTTLAGNVGSKGSSDGMGTAATFNNPVGLAVDAAGDVFVADYSNHTIRRITSAGVVSTIGGEAGSASAADGLGSEALFSYPIGVAVDAIGNLYVADSANNRISKGMPVALPEILNDSQLVAGTAGASYNVVLNAGGGTGPYTYTLVSGSLPSGLTLSSAGLLSGVPENEVISPVTVSFLVKVTDAKSLYSKQYLTLTLLPNPNQPDPVYVWQDFVGRTGKGIYLDGPGGIARDSTGSLYIADTYDHVIQKVTADRIISTFAGTFLQSGNTDGAATAAKFNYPGDVAVNASGDVFVADSWNHTIRKITPAGAVTTLAGSAGNSGSADGTGNMARFNGPSGLSADSSGNVFVADTNNHTIRKVTSAGVVTTMAGTAGASGSTDGTGSAARLFRPTGLAVDVTGSLFAADSGNHTIRKISSSGVVTTIAGLAGSSGNSDGMGSAARFNSPSALAVDAFGNIYVCDGGNDRIRKVTPAGLVTTISESGDFPGPSGVTLDETGRLIVLDYSGEFIAIGTPRIPPVLLTASSLPPGATGQTYFKQLTATGGARPLTWSKTAGSLPTGLALDSTTGEISGIPSSAGDSNFTVKVTSSEGAPASKTFTLSILGITTASPLLGTTNGFPYNLTLGAMGGTPPYSWALASGSLPAGLVMGINGTISGAPTVVGSFQVNIRVSDSNGLSCWKDFNLNSNALPVISSQSSLPETALYGPCRQTLATTGGSAPFTWTMTSGSLPPGLVLTNDGIISGTATQIGTFAFTLQAMDTQGASCSTNFTLVVGPSAQLRFITPETLPPGCLGTAYAGTLAASSGVPPLQWSIISGSLPTGLSLATDGNISGTPSAIMEASFVAQVIAANGGSSMREFNLAIHPAAPVITTDNQLSSGVPGIAYSQSLNASYGQPPYTWSLVSGSLPLGLSVSPAGVVSGMPPRPEIAAFRMRVSGADGLFAEKDFQVEVRNSTYLWSTLAGTAGLQGNTDGTGVVARFNFPRDLAMDSSGDLLVVDTNNSAIRKITPTGVVSTFAGGGGTGSTDGTGSVARFKRPRGVTMAASGTLYVADTENHTIRKITPTGVVTTIAGTAGSSGTVDGTGSAARFNRPMWLTADPQGNIFVSDTDNRSIRKITSAGVVTTFVAAGLISPTTNGIKADTSGNLYVTNNSWNSGTILKITSTAVVSTIAGMSETRESKDGTGSAARFYYPYGITADTTGNLYVSDVSHSTIRKINSAVAVITIGGVAGSSGSANGPGTEARFSGPSGMAVDASGTIYLADSGNHTIRKGVLMQNPMVVSSSLPGGMAGAPYRQDLVVTGGSPPYQWTIDSGALPVGLSMSSLGIIAGTPVAATSANFVARATDAVGLSGTMPLVLTVSPPTPPTMGVTGLQNATAGVDYSTIFTASGGLGSYIWSLESGTLPEGWSLSSEGVISGMSKSVGVGSFVLRVTGGNGLSSTSTFDWVLDPYYQLWTTLAGSVGHAGSSDGAGNSARFNYSSGIAVDGIGNTYVADTSNHTIRKVTLSGDVSTVAGSAGISGSADGTGEVARFNYPCGIAVNRAGELFVADSSNHTIRKISAAGVVTTVAGSAGVSGSTNGTGGTARLSQPYDIAVDSANNLFVSDTGNHTIRRITQEGVVTTLAGLAGAYGSDDGNGSAARFHSPQGIAIDDTGNLFVTDTYNNTIRKVTAAGVTSTVAGNAYGWGSSDGTGDSARFWNPTGITVDNAGNLFVTDGQYNNTIRKVTPMGVVTTFAGTPDSSGGSADGTRTEARFYHPQGIEVDSLGNILVSDQGNCTIRKLSVISVLTIRDEAPLPIGFATSPYSQSLTAVYGKGPFSWEIESGTLPDGLNLSKSGIIAGIPKSSGVSHFTVRVTDADGFTANKSLGLSISDGIYWANFAGSNGYTGVVDDIGSKARFCYPFGIATDVSGTVYVTDQLYHTIRRITPTGMVTTIAGQSPVAGSADGAGGVARFNTPKGIAVDGTGNVFVADCANHAIRKITSAGVVTTVAGTPGASGSVDGAGATARFYNPTGIATDEEGNLFVADTSNHTIRKVSPTGEVTTFAGAFGTSGSADGTAVVARFNSPEGVTMDNAGNLFVADTGNHVIRKIYPTGVVTTLAGTAAFPGSSDGIGSAARFNSPKGIAFGGAGNLFVADFGNHIIREVTTAGRVMTVAGIAGTVGYASGTGANARFYNPSGVAVDRLGIVYVAAYQNQCVSRGTPLSKLVIMTDAVLPSATVGTGYNVQINSMAGATPITWSIDSGTFPPGLSLDSLGSIEGTPGVSGIYNFTVRATDKDGGSATKAFIITINPLLIDGNPVSLPAVVSMNPLTPGVTGRPYRFEIVATGGAPPYTWCLASGGLPSGIALGEDGILSGVSLSPVYSNFIIQVGDSNGLSTAKRFELTIERPVLNSYESWKLTRFTDPAEQTNSLISGADADPDHDGIPNLLECALALEPKIADTSDLPIAKDEGGYLTFSYRQSKAATDLAFTPQCSADLTAAGWSTTGITETARKDMGDHWLVTVRHITPLATAPKRFLRLQVSKSQ